MAPSGWAWAPSHSTQDLKHKIQALKNICAAIIFTSLSQITQSGWKEGILPGFRSGHERKNSEDLAHILSIKTEETDALMTHHVAVVQT